MAPLANEDPSATGYVKPKEREVFYICAGKYRVVRTVLKAEQEPSYPKVRKDKRKNFNLS